MSTRILPLMVAVAFSCSACAKAKNDEWSNIDYSKVYKAAGENRDVDAGYRQPSVVGCVNDDLYFCK